MNRVGVKKQTVSQLMNCIETRPCFVLIMIWSYVDLVEMQRKFHFHSYELPYDEMSMVLLETFLSAELCLEMLAYFYPWYYPEAVSVARPFLCICQIHHKEFIWSFTVNDSLSLKAIIESFLCLCVVHVSRLCFPVPSHDVKHVVLVNGGTSS